MQIKRAAVAGTLESSDIMVKVLPDKAGIHIALTSSVENYYGDSIRGVILRVLDDMGIESANIEAVDHGALDCTIRARVTTAVRRASAGEGAAK